MFTNRPARNNGQTRPLPPLEQDSVLDSGTALPPDAYRLRDKVQRKLLADVDGETEQNQQPQMRQVIEALFNQVLAEENLIYTRAARSRLLGFVISDIMGYGPIEPLLNDATITEVMVNGPGKVYIERQGRIEKTNVTFENNEHLMRVIDRIVAPLGRRVDEASPMVDARLPNGYRVNATIPPLSLDGPLLTIRKFAQVPYTAQDLIANGTMSTHLAQFLRGCVEARVNIVISGGTGTGKTTLLNVLSAFIPNMDRIITIEDTAELQLKQEHVVHLEKRPPNVEGKGEVTIRQLVINALRMRPDRIIVGESRGGEALDMLQAMNTGHDGSMTTLHANSPRDAMRRIETMVMMAGMDMPLRAIREQVSSAIDMVVHVERLKDGTRKVTQVTEVLGMEGDVIVLQDLFEFEQFGYQSNKVIGAFKSTGLRPRFLEKFAANNIELAPNIFDPGVTL